MRKKIKLQQGEEIEVNGFVIRAIGPKEKPSSLSVYHPRVMVDHQGDTEKEREQRKFHLYAGIASRLLFESTMCVGLVKDLATCGSENEKTAKQYLDKTGNRIA